MTRCPAGPIPLHPARTAQRHGPFRPSTHAACTADQCPCPSLSRCQPCPSRQPHNPLSPVLLLPHGKPPCLTPRGRCRGLTCSRTHACACPRLATRLRNHPVAAPRCSLERLPALSPCLPAKSLPRELRMPPRVPAPARASYLHPRRPGPPRALHPSRTAYKASLGHHENPSLGNFSPSAAATVRTEEEGAQEEKEGGGEKDDAAAHRSFVKPAPRTTPPA